MISIADKIRKIASLIELDNTPYESSIGNKSMESKTDKDNKPKSKEIVPDSKPVAVPVQRRPRRQPSHKNKWNDDTKAGLMKEYMQNYRADGKVMETNGPKNFYVKKPKN